MVILIPPLLQTKFCCVSLILNILLESFHNVVKGYYIYMLHSVSQIHVDMIFGVPVIKKYSFTWFLGKVTQSQCSFDL